MRKNPCKACNFEYDAQRNGILALLKKAKIERVSLEQLSAILPVKPEWRAACRIDAHRTLSQKVDDMRRRLDRVRAKAIELGLPID